jgi:hypothetical protein
MLGWGRKVVQLRANEKTYPLHEVLSQSKKSELREQQSFNVSCMWPTGIGANISYEFSEYTRITYVNVSSVALEGAAVDHHIGPGFINSAPL